jgi:diguanylate cyclase (GGDEF)-like protein
MEVGDLSSYFIYYTESSIVCLIIFGIMIFNDYNHANRQEEQIKYDYALVSFMLYCVSDALWAAIIAGVVPKVLPLILFSNLSNAVIMAAIAYTWLMYVKTIEKAPNRNSSRTRRFYLMPLCISIILLINTYIVNPSLLLNDDMMPTDLYFAFQITVPLIYIVGILISSINKAAHSATDFQKKSHILVGFFSVAVALGGLVQVLILPETPVFCYCCAILMLSFYIKSLENRISTDPLTGLNNRGSLMHFVAQEELLTKPEGFTYVIMIDVNDFKNINDTYGHASGDQALRIVSKVLRDSVSKHQPEALLGRFGGDEFIIIAFAQSEKDIDALIEVLHAGLIKACENDDSPFTVSICAGYDMLGETGDSFQACMERADRKLYDQKKLFKVGR